MIINGKFCPEAYYFKTAAAARAFCRVHTRFVPTTALEDGYLAIESVSIVDANYDACAAGATDYQLLSHSAVEQLRLHVRERKLSYKNIITASILGTFLGTKYKMGRGEDQASGPVIFTYGIGCAAPEITLLCMLFAVLGLMLGIVPRVSMLWLALVYLTVEVLIPWVNSHSVDPIAEPWMIPKQLTDMKNED